MCGFGFTNDHDQTQNLAFGHDLEQTADFATCQNLLTKAQDLRVDVSTVAVGLSQDLDASQFQTLASAITAAIEAAKLDAAGSMRRCPMGYTWRREGNGYRCRGGTHYVSDGDVEKYMRQG